MEEDDFSLCVLDNARKAARAVSRHYDKLARQGGMTAGQFSVLVAIRQVRARTTADLADRLSMDRTTLIRNVALLERDGLVVSALAGDGKAKCFCVTERGEALLQTALPLWRKANTDVEDLLGTEEFLKTINALQRLSQL